MKRELKLVFGSGYRRPAWILQSLSRWKGNWNSGIVPRHKGPCGRIAEPIPMKRELKPFVPAAVTAWLHNIAEPIPMKRELKPWGYLAGEEIKLLYCRAYPDEKGIETIFPKCRSLMIATLQSLSRWKGNWNIFLLDSIILAVAFNCRAYPDEKGIETFKYLTYVETKEFELQSLSRWKGNWNLLLNLLELNLI